MAASHDWLYQSASVVWILTLILSESQSKKTHTYYMQDGDCGRTFSVSGATVFSHRSRSKLAHYGDNIDCKLRFKTKTHWKFMMRIVYLDIPDSREKGFCNDALYVFDHRDIFTASMTEAGGNKGLCGTSKPPRPITTSGPYLTAHFRSDSNGHTGRGFKFIVTAFSDEYRKTNSCRTSFQCDNNLCIDRLLVCDGVNHCGDGSDEARVGRSKCNLKNRKLKKNACQLGFKCDNSICINKLHVCDGIDQCGDASDESPEGLSNCRLPSGKEDSVYDSFLSLGVTASVAITVGSLVVIIVVVVAVICCCRKSSCRKSHDSQNGVTTTGSAVMANGSSGPYHPSQTPIHAFTPTPSCHYGYYPMQPVYPQSASSYPSIYSPLPHTRESYSHSSHPPSYHRSHTPTSSKSGKSIRSANSVPYSQVTDKIMLPVHL